MSMRDGEDVKSVQKSERSMMENGDVEEGLEFLEDEGEKEGEDPVATGNVADDDDRQPIPEGKVIQIMLRDFIYDTFVRNLCAAIQYEFV